MAKYSQKAQKAIVDKLRSLASQSSSKSEKTKDIFKRLKKAITKY